MQVSWFWHFCTNDRQDHMGMLTSLSKVILGAGTTGHEGSETVSFGRHTLLFLTFLWLVGRSPHSCGRGRLTFTKSNILLTFKSTEIHALYKALFSHDFRNYFSFFWPFIRLIFSEWSPQIALACHTSISDLALEKQPMRHHAGPV